MANKATAGVRLHSKDSSHVELATARLFAFAFKQGLRHKTRKSNCSLLIANKNVMSIL